MLCRAVLRRDTLLDQLCHAYFMDAKTGDLVDCSKPAPPPPKAPKCLAAGAQCELAADRCCKAANLVCASPVVRKDQVGGETAAPPPPTYTFFSYRRCMSVLRGWQLHLYGP